MTITATDYLVQLTALLPRGPAWNRAPGSVLGRVLEAVGESLARVHARAEELLVEADPRLTVELLDDWERMAGLPDPCAGEDQTLIGRRRRLVALFTEVGGQSRAYFIALASDLGYEITIDEFGISTCTGLCTEAITAEEWRCVWQVNAPENTPEEALCTGFCTDPLRTWEDEVLECALQRRKPAHTTILFNYGS